MQLKSYTAKVLASEIAKKERANAVEMNLMMRKRELQEHDLMQMSQLVNRQKQELEVANKTVVETRKKLKKGSR